MPTSSSPASASLRADTERRNRDRNRSPLRTRRARRRPTGQPGRHPRPRLRRAAARDRVRRGRPRGRGDRRQQRPRVAELHAGRSPIDDISDDRLARRPRRPAHASSTRRRRTSPTPTSSSSASRRRSPAPRTRISGRCCRAAALIREHLRAGQLVILQSTTFPGTTTGPFREELERSGLRGRPRLRPRVRPGAGQPGRSGERRRRTSRGSSARRPRPATRRAAALLGTINDNVLELSSPDAAELAKLLENVFRNVNIALVNQLALLCERMGLDVWEVIDAAATKPFGFMRFTPGPGVGGHCIPVDPYYLAWRAREFDFVDRFVELAGDINLAMPRHVVDLVAEALNERGQALRGARVGVLGVAFKPNVRDARNSPAAEVIGRPPRPRRRGRLPRSARADVPRRRRRRRTSRSPSTSCSRRATPSSSSRPTGRSTSTTSTSARTSSSTRSTARTASTSGRGRCSGSAPAGAAAEHDARGAQTRASRAPLAGPSRCSSTPTTTRIRASGARRNRSSPPGGRSTSSRLRRADDPPSNEVAGVSVHRLERPAPPGRRPADVPRRVPRVPRPRRRGP